MSDVLLNLIVLAALALIGSAILLLVRRSQAAHEQQLVQMTAERGWTYESIRKPLAWGLRITADEWTLETLSRSNGREAAPGSSDVSMRTTWHADAPGSTLLLGPRAATGNLGGLGDMLIRQVLGQALGADADGLVEVQAGDGEFRKRYMLWARDPVEVKSLLTPALQSALLAWQGTPPLVKRTSQGLTIELNGARLKRAEEIQALVKLGELLLH